MVQINGDQSSLTPPPPPIVIKPKPKPEPTELVCSACDGIVFKKQHIWRDNETVDGTCKYCVSFFGVSIIGLGRGATDVDPVTALKKSAEAKQHDWVMILRRVSVGSGDGASITLQMGDILKVARAGTVSQQRDASMDRTRQMFMIEVTVGGVVVWLYPHEYATVPFLTIMELKRLKQIEESFVGRDDAVGYFAPTDEMRKEIIELFGDR